MKEIITHIPDMVAVTPEQFTEAAIVNLYHLGKISEKIACEIIRVTRIEFDRLLTEKYRLPRLDADTDVQRELDAAN